MSDDAKEMEIRMCDSKSGGIQCTYGHAMIHTLYYDEANSKIRELNAEITRLNALIREQEIMEQKTMNHLLIEAAHGNIRLTLRGKVKVFTPLAILDMIRALKKAHNHVKSYTGPVMIHCSNGNENES